jgi:hypothetical protein
VNFVLVLIGASVLLAGHVVQAGSQPFTLTLGVEEPLVSGYQTSDGILVLKTGAKIYLTIKTTNTSKHEIGCEVIADYMIGLDPRYEYDVRDSQGKPVREHLIEHKELAGRAVQGLGCKLKPGESSTQGGNDITRLYDLSQPGKYTIQVSRPASDNPTDGVVKSNTLRLSITE